MLSNYFSNTKAFKLNDPKYCSRLDLSTHGKINTENKADTLLVYLLSKEPFSIFRLDAIYFSDHHMTSFQKNTANILKYLVF